MMKLKDSQQLQFYENHFYRTGFDTISCPEYLRKHWNALSWVYLVNATIFYLFIYFFAVEKLHSGEQMPKSLV